MLLSNRAESEKSVLCMLLGSVPILLFVMLMAVGCGNPVSSSPPTALPLVADDLNLRVALLLPGPIHDGSWNEAGLEGLHVIEQELGAEIAYTAEIPEAQFEAVFRQYAEDGFDFIIGHGGQFIPAAKVVADEFPHTQFAVIARYEGNNNNLGALSFRDSEAGYLAGVVAALKTETGHVAFISGIPYADIMEQIAGFEQGVEAIDPSIEVSVGWVGSWNAADKARAMTQAHIDKGADVLSINLDQDKAAAIDVVDQAGVLAIGWLKDQHELAPETVVTSVIQRVPVIMLDGAMLVQRSRWEGKLYRFGLQEKAQNLAPSRGALSDEEQATVDMILFDIKTGKIDISPERE